MVITNKPLPPFGEAMRVLLQQGMKLNNNLFLYLGNRAWHAAKNAASNKHVLALPPNHSPYEFDWPVQGCEVLAIDTSGVAPTLIEQTAHALLLAGAISMHVILANFNLVIYRRN